MQPGERQLSLRLPAGCPRSAEPSCRTARRLSWSAGDLEFVVNVDDAARHPGGTDHRIVLGPRADVAGQRDDAATGGHLDVAVVGNQRRAAQRLLDVQVDVDRVGVVADLDVVPDVAHPGQPGHRQFGGGALAGIPTVLFALGHSLTAGIVTAAAFIAYQQIENHVLNPVVMSRTVNVNPLVVLLSILVGTSIGDWVGGFFGSFVAALLSIPVAGALQVIVRELWQTYALPGPPDGEPDPERAAGPADASQDGMRPVTST